VSKFIITIDQSTSATKAMLIETNGRIIKRINKLHKQYYPSAGWVEHDAEEIYSNTISTIKELINLSTINRKDIIALAITNQRESVVVWDRNTHKPIYNAIVWQCNRGEQICENVVKEGYEQIIKQKTGLRISPYFSAPKIKWILDNVEEAKEKAKYGDIIFGTIDSWLIWKLTNGKSHVTDYSNASRTMLFNINSLNWDDEILEIFQIPKSMAPRVQFSDNFFGYTNLNGELEDEIPITGVMGDSHAALFGHGCFEKGMIKATYGTGSSIMMNIGNNPLYSDKLVTSIGWGFNNQVVYVLEGNINCTGATIRWLIDNLGLASNPIEIETISKKIEDTNGVYIVPAFMGLAAPYWKSNARAARVGMSGGTNKFHIIRAAEESIAYQIREGIEVMKEESKINILQLNVDGGPTNDEFLMQFQADILNIPVFVPAIEEVSALGSALMAALAVGNLKQLDEVKTILKEKCIYHNKMSEDKRSILYNGWKNAVIRVF